MASLHISNHDSLCLAAYTQAGLPVPQVVDVTASVNSGAVSQSALSFKGRRSGTSNVRRKLATSAVLQNYKPPPTAKLAAVPKGPMQRTIDELFHKQAVASSQMDEVSSMQLG